MYYNAMRCIDVYVYIYTYIYMYVCMHVCMMCIYVYVCVCVALSPKAFVGHDHHHCKAQWFCVDFCHRRSIFLRFRGLEFSENGIFKWVLGFGVFRLLGFRLRCLGVWVLRVFGVGGSSSE